MHGSNGADTRRVTAIKIARTTLQYQTLQVRSVALALVVPCKTLKNQSAAVPGMVDGILCDGETILFWQTAVLADGAVRAS
jgi:hypothetical protein